MTHPEGTIFVVSSIYRGVLNIGDLRTFTVEDDAWKYFMISGKGRCWVTYPDKSPVLISTKSYMRSRGLDY